MNNKKPRTAILGRAAIFMFAAAAFASSGPDPATLGVKAAANAGELVFAPGLLKQEFWANGNRQVILDGTAGTPTRVGAVSGFNLGSAGDNYAQRVSGFFIPASSGDYVFFLNSDDDTDLFLSTDADPANKKLIAREASWSNSLAWNTPGGGSSIAEDKRSDFFFGSEWPTPNQITLQAGQRYYIEAVHHEGTGGDHLQLYIKKTDEDDPADGAAPSYAGGSFGFLAEPATVTFTQQPAATTIAEGQIATLTVEATTTSQYGIAGYQWRRNGEVIPGATSATYTTPILQLADNGASYTVEVLAPGVTANNVSQPAVVTVTTDTAPPQLVSAGSIRTFTPANGNEVTLIFDESLTASTATVAANYTLDNGATVTAARLVTNSSGLNSLEDGVVLSVNGLVPGNSYTVSVRNVADAKGNAIPEGTPQTATFVAGNLSWISIGDTVEGVRNDVIAVSTNDFNLVNGGNAFWASDDDITMVYEAISGDFDKVTQIEWHDPSSNWARAGISARESLNNGQPTTTLDGENPASRYQMILADPMTKFDGTAANRQFETNRRLETGGATSGIRSGGQPTFPNVWVRLKRVGQRISTFYSDNGVNWTILGTTDFGDEAINPSLIPLADELFVGPTLGVENGNITNEGGTPEQQGAFAARFRDYGDFPQGTRGSVPYAIGLNFGSNEEGGQVSTNDVAGIPSVAQRHWNNLVSATSDLTGPVSGIVADRNGTAAATTVTVEYIGSPNTWASNGPRGENNSGFTGHNQNLMTGYLDTANESTTIINISNIPSDLTGPGYDVVVYALGGVPGRGGEYRVKDPATGNLIGTAVRAQGPTNPTSFVEAVPVADQWATGNYVLFKNLTAASISVEASTAEGAGFSDTPRAPINAIQLIPTGSIGSGGGEAPTLSIARNGAGVRITFEGRLQATTSLPGGWADVPNATSPYDATTEGVRFFRAVR